KKSSVTSPNRLFALLAAMGPAAANAAPAVRPYLKYSEDAWMALVTIEPNKTLLVTDLVGALTDERKDVVWHKERMTALTGCAAQGRAATPAIPAIDDVLADNNPLTDAKNDNTRYLNQRFVARTQAARTWLRIEPASADAAETFLKCLGDELSLPDLDTAH